MTSTMLTPIADKIWSTHHHFVVNGVPSTCRMTVIQLNDGGLWVHSPIPVSAKLKAQMDGLGPVRSVVAPNLAHHLFVNDFAVTFPNVRLYGTPGLIEKRPDLSGMQTLNFASNLWAPELEFLLFEGMPKINETVWFHPHSASLILTDICQDWQGPLAWQARVWATVSGVRNQFDVPLLVRLLTQDKMAARASAEAVLRWPIARVLVSHHAVIEQNAKQMLFHAFRHF